MSTNYQEEGTPELKSLLSDDVLRACEERISAADQEGGLTTESAAQPPVFQNPPKRVVRRLRRLGIGKSEAKKAVELMANKGNLEAATESYAIPSEAIPPDVSDDTRVGIERILGRNELMNVRFLAVGAARARAVARVVVRTSSGSIRGHGTGFLISPRLLLTNNHVLTDPAAATSSTVEFGYEIGLDGTLFEPSTFRLKPGEFFLTDKNLDFTLVAVDPTGSSGAGLAEFGFIRMDDTEDDILVNETVNIIQHPNGERKQVALRENEVIGMQDSFLHYKTDTAPGSSGSCVLNDQWDLVALHHAGKPKRDNQGRILARDGRLWDRHTMSDRDIDWIANEGIRVSALVHHLRSRSLSDSERALLDEALATGGGETSSAPPILPATPSTDVIKQSHPPDSGSHASPPTTTQVTIADRASTITIPLEITIRVLPAISADTDGSGTVSIPPPGNRAGIAAYDPDVPETEAISIDQDYSHRKGYDQDFLGSGKYRVRLPWLSSANYAQVAFNKEISDPRQRHILPYHHYSVVMNGARRLAFFTAVNINGGERRTITRGTDKWFFDPRIEAHEQVGNELYTDNPLDRGHLVRRLDPAWGSSLAIATVANDDTFHYTNCAPQHANFNRNRATWQGIENYILKAAEAHDLKVSVFTGPVFRNSDRLHRGVKIPRDFWKVVVIRRSNGNLSATAYLLSQEDLIEDLPKEVSGVSLQEDFAFGDYKLRQVPIWKIEDLTGLSFRRLKAYDPKGAEAAFETESLAGVEELTDLEQIVF